MWHVSISWSHVVFHFRAWTSGENCLLFLQAEPIILLHPSIKLLGPLFSSLEPILFNIGFEPQAIHLKCTVEQSLYSFLCVAVVSPAPSLCSVFIKGEI